MPRKRNPKSLENLKPPYSAADGAKELRLVSVKLPASIVEALDNLPGDRSTNIRAAITAYLSEK
jgi:hypothetical protein